MLAAYVEEAFGEQVSLTLKSLELDNLSDVGEYLKQDCYSVIGISTKIRAFDKFQKSVEVIRRESPESLIVVGDILATYTFEEVLRMYEDVICVRGEGEVAFTEIIREILGATERSFSFSHIPNLAYLAEGNLQLTERRSIDLMGAKHPKRFLAQEVLKQNGIARIEASRGCAYSLCDFCGTVEKYSGPGWRPVDLGFIIKELSILSGIGFKSPYFTDEDFFGNDTQRVYKFAEGIIDAKKDGAIDPNLDFYINLRVNSVLGIGWRGKQEAVRLLGKLKESGLREVFIGLESGCRGQLKRYRKGATKEKNIQAIRTLREIGLEADLGFIFLDPESTIADLRENLSFIYEAGISYQDSHLIKRLRIEPRTPIGFRFIRQNPNAVVDLNLVEIPYSFQQPEVARIFEAFATWQKGDLDVIYNLQSFCRGEIPQGYTRKQIKDIISKYRDLDVRYLDELVRIFEIGEREKDKQITGVTQRFEGLRECF